MCLLLTYRLAALKPNPCLWSSLGRVLDAHGTGLRAFPSSKGFCTIAEELGVRESDHRGPCLVLLSNCTVAPEDLNHHIRSTFLRGYVVRVYWYEHTSSSRFHCISHLKSCINNQNGRGNGLPSGSFCQKEEADKYFRESASATRELSVQQTVNLQERVSSDQKQVTAAPDDSWNNIEVEQYRPKLKVRLQTYPRDLADSMIEELTGVECGPHNFSCSLYAVHVDGIYRYGIGSGNHMYLAPCDREDLAKGYISRASLKLEEIVQVLGFHLHQDMIAVDLGASPGAWTQYLSKHVKLVIAVDPAPLDKQVLQSNVTHIRKMAQDATEELLAYSKGKGFDLLVCDINRHPVEAAQVVSPLLVHLCQGGLLVLTLKFHGRGRDKELKVDEIKGIFRRSLIDMECISLLANSVYERTFVGIKM